MWLRNMEQTRYMAMRSLISFNIRYFIIAMLLFATEILIAMYVHDTIVRPFFGDVLVVILIYTFIKSFINTPIFATAIGVLLFSFLIETLQYFQFVKLIGLEHSKLANIVIGNYFTWTDLLAYLIGIIIVLFAELSLKKNLINPR